jgi:hypothetical protein
MCMFRTRTGLERLHFRADDFLDFDQKKRPFGLLCILLLTKLVLLFHNDFFLHPLSCAYFFPDHILNLLGQFGGIHALRIDWIENC